MTERLYQKDSYFRDFKALVLETDTEENALILDRTAFFPGGGGQLCDLGTLCFNDLTFPVSKVFSRDGNIWHRIEGKLPEKGLGVRGIIDWDRRFKLMRTHTAMHVLCGVIWRDYGASVTGGNMEVLKARMDFEFETMRGELVRDIEDKVNAEIKKGAEVRINILPREEAFKIPDLIRTKINLLPPGIEEVRTVEIVGLDLQADGGTHLSNIGEIGEFRVTDYKSKGKINKRIFVKICDI